MEEIEMATAINETVKTELSDIKLHRFIESLVLSVQMLNLRLEEDTELSSDPWKTSMIGHLLTRLEKDLRIELAKKEEAELRRESPAYDERAIEFCAQSIIGITAFITTSGYVDLSLDDRLELLNSLADRIMPELYVRKSLPSQSLEKVS